MMWNNKRVMILREGGGLWNWWAELQRGELAVQSFTSQRKITPTILHTRLKRCDNIPNLWYLAILHQYCRITRSRRLVWSLKVRKTLLVQSLTFRMSCDC